jgi:hypothetical protein
VVLKVDDGRGGVATQSYTIAVQPAPGDSSPVIITTPYSVFTLQPPLIDLLAYGSSGWKYK